MHRRYIERSVTISGQLPGHEFHPSDDFVVLLNQVHHPVKATPQAGGYRVLYGGDSYEIRTDWQFGQPLYQGTFNNEPFCMQVERRGLSYHLFHWGTLAKIMVLEARAAELQALMPQKAPPDMSKFLLSPMPGLLTDIAVSAGQEVKAGEKLAVIEAMKMENVLKAEHDGVVAKLLATPGESLAVDQAIIEFR
jgi:propionyl-CoA carboxylase alpha chain